MNAENPRNQVDRSRARARSEASSEPCVNGGQELLRAVNAPLNEIAAECSVSKALVSNWRTGIRLPSPDARERLEQAYGIPQDEWDVRHASDEPAPSMELDADGPPLEATMRHVDQVLANLMLPGATDDDRKQAEALRKILTTRAAMETKSSHVDAYLEKAMMDPERQRYYIDHVEYVIEVLKRERDVAQCGCMAAITKMLAEREARRALGR